MQARNHWLGRGGCVLLVSVLSAPAFGQTAYFSLEGDINTAGDQYDFTFDLSRSVTSAETLFFETHSDEGGTNTAGDTIAASSFDSDLNLFNGVNTQIAQSDEIDGFNNDYDALLSWAGVQTDPDGTPLPDPLGVDSYRLNLKEFGNSNTGPFAVDLVGPADALVFTGGSPVNGGTVSSLKFGSNDGGTALYNHSVGTFTTLGELVVAQTGNANLNLSGGTLTAGGLTTVNTGGTVTQTGGTLNANGGLTVDGGQYNRTSGDLSIASGQQLRVQGGGLLDWDGSSILLDDTNTSVVVSGAGSTLRNNDTGTRSMSIRNGVSVDVILGGEVIGDYLVVGETGTGGTVNVDGAGSSLNFSSGTHSDYSHYLGVNSGTNAFLNLSNNATATLSDTLGTELRVGAFGSNGTANVLSGADLTIDGLDMDETGTSTVTVNGAGSTLTQTGTSTTTIGSASGSTGTVNVENGAIFTTGTGTTTVNATGTLTVSGGVFEARGTLDLQTGGTINITSNGVLRADTLALNGGTYNNPSSIAILDVNRLQNFGTLSQTGIFTVGSAQAGTSTSSVVIGNAETITVGNATTVGFNKPGHVTINSGGQLLAQSDARIGTFGGISNGSSVDINAGGLFDVTGSLLVGGLNDTNLAASTVTIDGAAAEVEVDGTLTILDGSTVTHSNGGILDANGGISIEGGTLNLNAPTFQWAGGNTMTVSDGGQVSVSGGQWDIQSGNTVEVLNGNLTQTGGVFLGIGGAGTGTVTINGANASMNVSGAQTDVSNSGSTGTLNFLNGATGTLGQLDVGRSNATATTDATVNVLSGSSLTTQSFFIGNFDGNEGTGTVNLSGSGSSITQSLNSFSIIGNANTANNVASHTLNVADSAVFTSGTGVTTINETGTLDINTGGTFNANGTVSLKAGGTLILNGGNLNAITIDHTHGGFFDFLDGRLSVETFVGNLDQFGGTLAPGASAGLTVISGGYGLETAGTLEIELAGINPGTNFDRVEVGNDAFLFGALDVSLVNGFTPTFGDSFEFLTAGGVLIDSFSSITLPSLPANAVWSLNNTGGSLTLSIDSTLVGDLNNDGFVGIGDLNIVLADWNQSVPPADPRADPSGDGFVGIDDLNAVLGNWNNGTPPPPIGQASIPEPATLMFLAAGFVGVSYRRRG